MHQLDIPWGKYLSGRIRVLAWVEVREMRPLVHSPYLPPFLLPLLLSALILSLLFSTRIVAPSSRVLFVRAVYVLTGVSSPWLTGGKKLP